MTEIDTHNSGEFTPADAVMEFGTMQTADTPGRTVQGAIMPRLLDIAYEKPLAGYAAKSTDGRADEMGIVLDDPVAEIPGSDYVILLLTRRSDAQGNRTQFSISATFVDTVAHRIARIRLDADPANVAMFSQQLIAGSQDAAVYGMRLQKIQTSEYNPDVVAGNDMAGDPASGPTFLDIVRILESGVPNQARTANFAAHADTRMAVA